MRSIALGLILLISSCAHHPHSRSPGSVEKSCQELVQAIISPKKEGLWNKGLTAIKNSFDNVSYQTKLSYLKAMMLWRKDDAALSLQMADLLNYALERQFIDESTVKEMLQNASSEKVSINFVSGKVVAIDLFEEKFPTLFNSQQRLIDLLGLDEPGLFNQINLKKSEWDLLSQTVSSLPADQRSLRKTLSYIGFATGLPQKRRTRAFANLSQYFGGEIVDGDAKTFASLEVRFQNYRLAALKRELARGQSRATAETLADSALSTYQHVTHSCRARGGNELKTLSASRGTKFFIGLGTMSTAGSYFYNNWDKEKDSRWFGNLGWDLATTVVYNYLFTKVLGSSQAGYAGRNVQTYTLFGTVDFLNAKAYAKIFGVPEAVAEERLAALSQSPEIQEEVAKLIERLEASDLDSKFAEELKTVLGDLEAGDLDSLDSEETKAALLEAIALELYDKEAGEWIRTGDRGLDRYFFHRSWDVVTTPKGLAVGMLIFNILCKNVHSPAKAISMALSIYVVDKVVSDYLYYSLRRKAINL
jgi:hypothetical protein